MFLFFFFLFFVIKECFQVHIQSPQRNSSKLVIIFGKEIIIPGSYCNSVCLNMAVSFVCDLCLHERERDEATV